MKEHIGGNIFLKSYQNCIFSNILTQLEHSTLNKIVNRLNERERVRLSGRPTVAELVRPSVHLSKLTPSDVVSWWFEAPWGTDTIQ